MSDFTYEKENNNSPLETFEWDNVWWEHTENKTDKRVLYIGDSISCGTRRIATETSGNTVLFDGFGTSKALDNPYFKDSLSVFMKQEQRIDAILFNNGLHGWHLSIEEYEQKYGEMLEFIKTISNAPIYIVLTTNLSDGDERNETVIKRNEIAKKYAEKFGLKIIDLYSTSVKYSNLHTEDGVHFVDDGYKKLAESILNVLKDNGI